MNRRGAVAGLAVALALVIALAIVKRSPPAEPARSPSAPPAVAPTSLSRSASPSPRESARAEAAAAPITLDGRVEVRKDEPVAGATVEIFAYSAGIVVELPPATSGADGRFSVDIAVAATLKRPTAPSVELWGRARAPLMMASEAEPLASFDVFPGGSLAAERPLRLWHGAAARGRVVDVRGAPVPLAKVALGFPGGDAVAQVGSDLAGRFALPVSVAGEGGIRVDAPLGETVLAPIVFAPDTDLELGDIVIDAGGVISGVAVFPDGAPVPRLRIVAHCGSIASDEEADGSSVAFAPTAGAGRAMAAAETAGDGTFRLSGLRLGSFGLRCPDLRFGVGSDVEFPAETGSGETRVVVDWHRVRVRVVGSNGVPLTRARVTFLGWAAHREAEFRSFVASGAEPSSESSGADIATTIDGDSEAFVPRGAFLVARAESRAGSDARDGFAQRTFEVPFGSNETALDLTLAASATGRVRLDITDVAGRPVAAARAMLCRVDDDVTFKPETIDAEGFLDPVRPGRYRVLVAPGDPAHGPAYLPLEADVVVAATADATVPLVATPGGRLRVTVVAAEPIDEWISVPSLLTADGERVDSPWGFDSEACVRRDEQVFAWETGLESGAYRLQVGSIAFWADESRVAVVAGETTDVVIELKRRQ